jgi:hypothetical protein
MPDFDMPARPASFETRGGWVCRALMQDLGLPLNAAGGIVGNVGFESGGFETLHEIGQPEGVGGYGWGQWTATRRRTFFAWCKQHGLDWQSDEANYGYLVEELKGAYRQTVNALKGLGAVVTLEDAVFSVGQTYERPGGTTPTHLPGFNDRLHYGRRAVAGVGGGVAPPPPPPPAVSADDITQLQRRLNAAGIEPALAVDGVLGEDTRDALRAFQEERGLPVSGNPDAATLAALLPG